MGCVTFQVMCCGIESPDDWKKVPTGIPASCCETSDCREIRKVGCVVKVKDVVKKLMKILLYIVICAMGLQVITVGSEIIWILIVTAKSSGRYIYSFPTLYSTQYTVFKDH